MTYTRLTPSVQMQLITPATYIVSNGYFRVDDSRIVLGMPIAVTQMYITGMEFGYSYTLQVGDGFMNVYVRTASGAYPSDGTRVKVAFILFG